MKIVGSQTGAYEFDVELPGQILRLGKTAKSDLDVVLDHPEETPPEGCDISTMPLLPGFPYIESGKLIQPEEFDYLCFPILLKSRRGQCQSPWRLHDKTLRVTDRVRGKSFCLRFRVDFAEVPIFQDIVLAMNGCRLL